MKRKIYVSTLMFTGLLTCFLLFQNCGKSSSSNTASHESIEQIDTPLTPAEEIPVIQSSNFDWSLDKSSKSFRTLTQSFLAQCPSLQQEFVATKKLVPVILVDGLLPNDPVIPEMDEVKKTINLSIDLAFCSFLAKTKVERDLAKQTLFNYIEEWDGIYVGDGNPSNDEPLLKLFITADLLMPKMTQKYIDHIKSIASKINQKEIAFWQTLSPKDTQYKLLKDEYLVARIYANLFLQNTSTVTSLRNSLNKHLQTIFTQPPAFTPSTCVNLASVGVYGSYPLQLRDSLTSHVHSMSNVLFLHTMQKSSLLDTATLDTLKVAVDILQPYTTGEKTHAEYHCSTLPLDKERLAIDPTLGKDWNPSKGRGLFRFARLIWPSTRVWTEQFVSSPNTNWQNLYFSGKGDASYSSAP